MLSSPETSSFFYIPSHFLYSDVSKSFIFDWIVRSQVVGNQSHNKNFSNADLRILLLC